MCAPMVIVLVLLVVAMPTSLATAPPLEPTSEAGCVRGGGRCLPSGDCYEWQRRFPGICGHGRECCFQDYTSHSLDCGLFGGECSSAASCGEAPRHQNAYCPQPDQVCCVWLV